MIKVHNYTCIFDLFNNTRNGLTFLGLHLNHHAFFRFKRGIKICLRDFNDQFGLSKSDGEKFYKKVVQSLTKKGPGQIDSAEVLKIKGLTAFFIEIFITLSHA